MIKFLFILIFTTIVSLNSKEQTNNIKLKIDSLKYLDERAFECNSIYWQIISSGKKAIPFLIANIDDTTQTQIKYVCKNSKLKFGDICYQALTEIMHIPLFYITKVQFDVIDGNGCVERVFTYLDKNRKKFKVQISQYYSSYKNNLKFIKYSSKYIDRCKKRNRIFGYYDIDWNLLKN